MLMSKFRWSGHPEEAKTRLVGAGVVAKVTCSEASNRHVPVNLIEIKIQVKILVWKTKKFIDFKLN